MDSGLEVSSNRDASMPGRHVPPPQPNYDQYRLPIGDQEHNADKSYREVQQHDGEKSSSDQQKHRVPFGWTPVVFALVVGTFTAIVVGAAVGGGLGGSLASSKRCPCLVSCVIQFPLLHYYDRTSDSDYRS